MVLTTDIVSYYKCDTDGSFPDSVGSNNGTINGATYSSSGKIDGCYSFDGSNDYVNFGNAQFFSDDFTVSLWIKPDSFGTASEYHHVLSNDDPYNVNHFNLRIYPSNNRLEFHISDSSGDSVGGSFTSFSGYVGSWVHIVGTYDSSTHTFTTYIDGSLNGTSTNTNFDGCTSSYNLYAGFTSHDTDYRNMYYDGSMDEIGIWDRALSSTEVSQLYSSGLGNTYPFENSTLLSDITSYYKFDTDNATQPDSVGSNDGTVSGATYTSSGKINGCYSFDGSNDYVKVSNNIYSSPSEMTISAWFNRSSDSSDNVDCVVHHSTTTSIGTSDYWIGVGTDPEDYITGTIGANDAGQGWDSGETTIHADLDTWYHVVVTWDGSVVKTYVNGNLEVQYSLASFTGLTAPTRFGASSDGLDYRFNGLIDEVGFWTRALTSDEITELYNSGDGLQYPFSTSTLTDNAIFFGGNF